MTKKTLLYITGNENLKENAFQFLQLHDHEAITIYGNFTTELHPFGSVVKAILMTAYLENVEEIYLVGSISNEKQFSENEIRQWLKQEGITESTFNILDYLGKFNQKELSNWLVFEDKKETVSKNITMLKTHPLLPKKLSFKGIVFEGEEVYIY